MPRFAYSPSRVAVLAAAMLASAAVPLAAAPLDLTAVPADAKWLMHVDMDAARDSVVVQRAGERMLKMHPHAGRVRPGSIVVARATAVDPDTKCPVLKQGKGFRVAMGEHDGKSFYRARLEMASPAAADDVVDVVKGFTALASLRWGGEADAMKLVDAAKTVVEGDTCTISWDADADEVWKVVERAADAWEKRHRGRHGAGGCPACGKDGCGGCGKGECPVMKGGKAEAEKPLRDDEF